MTQKVFFTLPSECVADAESGILVGEFNNWNPAEGIYLQKQQDGSMLAELALTPGKTYEYRYLLSDGRWVNDYSTKKFSDTYSVENCIVAVPEVEETIVAKKVPAAKKTKQVKEVAELTDDLTRINGINKKVEELLYKEQIKTYKQLAKVTIKKLQLLLDGAGVKFSSFNPSSWPKQAKLASTGKWDDLNAYLEEIQQTK